MKARNGDGAHLNHYAPAAYFLTEQATLLPLLDEDTLARAAQMFERVNECLTD